jgi:hypothetical protein
MKPNCVFLRCRAGLIFNGPDRRGPILYSWNGENTQPRPLQKSEGLGRIALLQEIPGTLHLGVSEITYKQAHRLENDNMKRSDCYKVTKAIVGAIAVALVAIAFYPVRELLAALLIFSVLSGTVGMALLILFLVQELALKGVTQLEARLACVRARHAAISGQLDDDQVLRSPRWN